MKRDRDNYLFKSAPIYNVNMQSEKSVIQPPFLLSIANPVCHIIGVQQNNGHFSLLFR